MAATMNKSHLGKANNPHPVVTPLDIGSYVNVTGVGKGILRYVGSIHGKDGMFCGIELETDTGKHDGSYQGVSYFTCPPQRGIFAPTYKVELDDSDDVPMMSMSQVKKGTERLSRSALPTLQLRNVCRPEDPMTSSFMTDSSVEMDSSLFSQGSWGDADMCSSNATYVIPPGRGHFDHEECDLMELTAPRRVLNIDREALKREEERLLGTSFVVEQSRIGVENLPIVEDEELETPLVEQKAPPFLQPVHGSPESPLDKGEPYAAPPSPVPEGARTRPISPQSVDTGYNGESDTSRLSQKEPEPKTETGPPKATTKPAKVVKKKEPPAKMKPPPVEQKEKEKPPKKEKEAPPPPKFPVKPKPPSKHQLMMQQLKASIEAEKNKPKKEPKARVHLVPPPPPKQKENEDKMSEAGSVSRAKQPLKTVNASPPKPPVERQKKERKPLYVPPPPKERKEKEVVADKTVSPKTVTKEKVASNTSLAAKRVKPAAHPTSSFAGAKGRTSISAPGTSRQPPKPTKTIDEATKLSRLQHATKAADVFSIMFAKREEERLELEERLREAEKRLTAQSSISDTLKARLTAAEKHHSDEMERLKNHGENVTRAHYETVERLKERHENQLAEKSKEHERALEDERSRQEVEVEAMSRRHQKVIVSLDEKIAETEKLAEQLKTDKKALQTALANDSDQRNQMLTKEINSLQTALEFKSSEMKELRQKYQQLALRVEEIPVKDLEITKLKHKVLELKQSLDQKMNYEKILVHQNEDLKRHQILVEEEKDEMRRSIDVMVYKYENADDGELAMNSSRYSTPGKVTFRSRSSNSSHRPVSGIHPESRLSQSSFSDMDRSVDRDSLTRSTVSMYASQYKLPENHADDVIYAPDEIIMGGTRQNLLFSEGDVETSKVNGNVSDPQTDSGIAF